MIANVEHQFGCKCWSLSYRESPLIIVNIPHNCLQCLCKSIQKNFSMLHFNCTPFCCNNGRYDRWWFVMWYGWITGALNYFQNIALVWKACAQSGVIGITQIIIPKISVHMLVQQFNVTMHHPSHLHLKQHTNKQHHSITQRASHSLSDSVCWHHVSLIVYVYMSVYITTLII